MFIDRGNNIYRGKAVKKYGRQDGHNERYFGTHQEIKY